MFVALMKNKSLLHRQYCWKQTTGLLRMLEEFCLHVFDWINIETKRGVGGGRMSQTVIFICNFLLDWRRKVKSKYIFIRFALFFYLVWLEQQPHHPSLYFERVKNIFTVLVIITDTPSGWKENVKQNIPVVCKIVFY